MAVVVKRVTFVVFSLVLLALLATAASVMRAEAQSAMIKVDAPSGKVAKSEKTVEVHLTAVDLPPVAGYQIGVQYNTDVLKFNHFERGPFKDQSTPCMPGSRQEGTIVFGCLEESNDSPMVSGSGDLGTVYFDIVGSGVSEITLMQEYALLIDKDVNTIGGFTLQDGRVEVSGGGSSWMTWVVGGAVVVAIVGAGLGGVRFLRRRA